MEFYSTDQVERLLNQILDQIPTNNPKFNGIRRYVEKKKEHIHQYIGN